MALKMTAKCVVVFLAILFLTAKVNAEETPVLKTKKDKVSYMTGVDMARNLKRQGIEIDPDILIKGFKDAFSGEKLLMTDEELHAVYNAFQAELKRKQIEDRQKLVRLGEDNKKEGIAFLAENKAKEGVVTLPSGLQYKVMKAGEGKKPTDSDTIECTYRGTLINGTEFDSSPRDGQPATFKVAKVIPGWREALKLMPVGSRWQIFIPPQLAYGPQGYGAKSRRTPRSF